MSSNGTSLPLLVWSASTPSSPTPTSTSSSSTTDSSSPPPHPSSTIKSSRELGSSAEPPSHTPTPITPSMIPSVEPTSSIGINMAPTYRSSTPTSLTVSRCHFLSSRSLPKTPLSSIPPKNTLFPHYQSHNLKKQPATLPSHSSTSIIETLESSIQVYGHLKVYTLTLLTLGRLDWLMNFSGEI